MDDPVQQPPQRLSSLTAWSVLPAGTPTYFRYWGKARKEEEKGKDGPPCHLLPYHCLDVAAVAVEYLRRHRTLREHFKALLKIKDDEHLYGWIAFWMALHDLGKFSEAFQGQREDLLRQLKERAPRKDKAYTVRHDSLGMLFWNKRLLAALTRDGCFDDDFDREDGLNAWARAVTGHHGQPPQEIDRAWTFFFDEQDAAAILDFTGEIRRLFLSDGVSDILALQDGDDFRLASTELSWWIAGLTVLADWIGSNAEVFTYCAEPLPSLDAYWERARRLAVQALDDSGVLPVESREELGFDKLFPSIATPSPLQDWAAKVALSGGPQIHILEDVTGAGKTEAAVMLVHRLMASGAADGFFIGLPTMATANAMYSRIADVYATLFAGIASLTLPHGKSSLVEEFAASVVRPGHEERDNRQKDETATARCTAWLADHRKRALLAPAGVGTIDQALLGALQSRHQSLRLLGLFRKVLVVDEVHACDDYMQRVLEVLLRLHAQAGGSAVLLSATLPQAMKQSLLQAFAQGCGLQQAPQVKKDDFPLATSWNPSQPERLDEKPIATRPDVSRTVEFQFLSSQDAVIEKIEQALAAGRCVAWIRNTVADAMEAYRLFASKLPPEKLLLFHARFALGDRLAMEAKVLKCFGPRSTPDDRRGRLLICTQVAEQSLDIDMDVLVTDLAPMDRVLQRAGRQGRHVRDANGLRLTEPGAKDGRGTPCVLVYGPPWTQQPASTWVKQAFPKAWRVYPHHGQLWLTAGLLQNVTVTMPRQARALIEGVFSGEAEVPEGLEANANAAEGKRYGDISEAGANCVKPGGGYARLDNDWLEDAKTPSRLGEATKEILLACWEGDELRPWFPHEKRRHAWAYSSVRMAARQITEVPDPASETRLAALKAVKESLPGKGRWVVVLPLELIDGHWVGQALGAPPNDKQPARLRIWRYDERMGLLAEEAPDGSPSGA